MAPPGWGHVLGSPRLGLAGRGCGAGGVGGAPVVGARLLGTWLGLKLTAGGCYTPRPGAPLTVLKFRVSFLENPGEGTLLLLLACSEC